MFALRYCCDLGNHIWDYKIFDTVGAALKWWQYHIGSGGTRFYDMLYVIPPGQKNPVQWCIDNIKIVADTQKTV
jgi:hypothetical protein